MLLQSALVTYLGSQNEDIRRLYIQRWLSLFENISSKNDFNILQLYRKDSVVWKHWGLQPDHLSHVNAAIIASSSEMVRYSNFSSLEYTAIYRHNCFHSHMILFNIISRYLLLLTQTS